MHIESRCHCGKVAYQPTLDPDVVFICHCTECQTLSGSPYRVAMPAAAADFVLLRGDVKIYIKAAESGTKRPQAFRPDGGTPIYAADAHDPPIYSLRIGAIRQGAVLRPGRHWWRSALPWSMDISARETGEGE